jgi:hypothetical protein
LQLRTRNFLYTLSADARALLFTLQCQLMHAL